MKNIKYYFLTFLMLSFLLPFVPPGCSDMSGSKETAETTDTSKVNSTTAITSPDSLVKTDSVIDSKQVAESTSDSIEYHPYDSVNIGQRIFMSPDRDHLSGTGYLINYFVLEYFLVFFSFCLPLVVALQSLVKHKLVTLKDKHLILIGFAFLSLIAVLHHDILVWGFWVALGIYLLTTISFFFQKSNSQST